MIEEYGEETQDWPADQLERFVSSLALQSQAADRLWEVAPAGYSWADVRELCA